MLKAIPSKRLATTTYRYTQQDRTLEILAEMGIDADGIYEMVATAGMLDAVAARDHILNNAFITRLGLPVEQTRFSDGTIRVFYSALEPQTAAHEAFDWYMKTAISGAKVARDVFYMLASWQFDGEIKDLQPFHTSMPYLTEKDSVSLAKCNEIGAEAASSGLDGLLSPSAALKQGTCLPVFQPRALPTLEYLRLEKFTLDPSSRLLTVSPA